jgi:hypothetical protein
MTASIINSLYYISLLLASLVSLVSFKNLESPYQKLAILILITSGIEIVAIVTYKYFDLSNNIIYHFSTPVEFFFYSMIYRDFFKSHKWNLVLFLCMCTLLLLEIGNTVFFQGLFESNTNTIIAESVLLAFLSLSLFIKISKNLHYDNLLKESIFWFNSAVLFFYSFSILIWGFHSIKVYTYKDPPGIIYKFYIIICALFYLTLVVVLRLNANKVKSSEIVK